MRFALRLANRSDAGGCLAIYAPYVEASHTTFETEVPTAEQFSERIDATLRTHPWIVAVADGRIAGYAYASRFKDRAAYCWTAEVSVYVSEDWRRCGVARALYGALIRCLRELGHVSAVGLIALPNDASVILHEGLGFRRVALLPRAGFKLGRWHDVGWWWLALQPAPDAPAQPRPLATCSDAVAGWVQAP